MPAKRRRKAAQREVGLSAREVASASPPPEMEALAARVAADGGAALAIYREPFQR
jgi:ParB family chromosome partitioning protein